MFRYIKARIIQIIPTDIYMIIWRGVSWKHTLAIIPSMNLSDIYVTNTYLTNCQTIRKGECEKRNEKFQRPCSLKNLISK